MFGKSLGKYRELGILLLRAGLGVSFILAHGAPKLFAGPERWTATGAALKHLGIDFAPSFWGLMAGSTEFFGGVLLVLGLMVRPVCLLLLIVMSVAAVNIYAGSTSFVGPNAHPLELGVVLLSLLIFGAGKYSVDQKLGLN